MEAGGGPLLREWKGLAAARTANLSASFKDSPLTIDVESSSSESDEVVAIAYSNTEDKGRVPRKKHTTKDPPGTRRIVECVELENE